MFNKSFRLTAAAFAVSVAVLLAADPSSAQSTGTLQGTVKDAKGQPVEGAQITVALQEGITRRSTTRSRKDGTFTQIGLVPGRYRVTAEKTGLGVQEFDVSVAAGQSPQVNFVLAPGQGGRAVEQDPEKEKAMLALFDAGVAASRAGRIDDAIDKYKQAIETSSRCHQCYYNLGVAYAQKKAYPEAEEAFTKAIDLKPDYADAYNGLANVYNAQRKFDEAQAASREAAKHSAGALGTLSAGGNPADAAYSEAIVLWNASLGDPIKVEAARAKFEEVIKLKPDHADAHYWLGMAHLNRGRTSEAASAFDTYLKLAPTGQYAAEARDFLSKVKP
jgi:Tfp pilus assembly protein PilF